MGHREVGVLLALVTAPSSGSTMLFWQSTPAAICDGAIRYRARLMYDGECFTGMQAQSASTSVACALEAALKRRFGRPLRVSAAGRTDSGVHARGQALHFDVPFGIRDAPPPSAHELQITMNALIPASVRVTHLEEAPEVDAIGRRWHARYWSTGKLYSYRLSCGGVADPLERRQRFHVGHRPLDLPAMEAAASHLLGYLDCAAFANRPPGESAPIDLDPSLTRRLVRRIDLVDEGDGRLRLDFHVQSALYKMVRNMAGLLVRVGSPGGGLAPEDVPALVASRDRGRLPKPAPAHGLTLESVFYAVGWGGDFDSPIHDAGEVAERAARGAS